MLGSAIRFPYTINFDVENVGFDVDNNVFDVDNDVFDVDNDDDFFKCSGRTLRKLGVTELVIPNDVA